MALGACLNFEYVLALQKHTGKKSITLCSSVYFVCSVVIFEENKSCF